VCLLAASPGVLQIAAPPPAAAPSSGASPSAPEATCTLRARTRTTLPGAEPRQSSGSYTASAEVWRRSCSGGGNLNFLLCRRRCCCAAWHSRMPPSPQETAAQLDPAPPRRAPGPEDKERGTTPPNSQPARASTPGASPPREGRHYGRGLRGGPEAKPCEPELNRRGSSLAGQGAPRGTHRLHIFVSKKAVPHESQYAQASSRQDKTIPCSRRCLGRRLGAAPSRIGG